MKKLLIKIGIYVVLAIVAVFSVKSCVDTKRENKRLAGNQTALLEGVTYYRTQDSLSAASVAVLTLEMDEFKQHYSDLVKEANGLNLKVKRLEAASRTATKTVYKTITEWKDSIVVVGGSIDTIRCLDYSDAYLTFNACERSDTVTSHIEVRDTLVQFIHRVPRKCWFIKWGTKGIRQEVVSKNPNTQITYAEYINFKK